MKSWVSILSILFFIGVFASCAEQAQPGAAVNAEEVFVKRCATCHGSEGNLEMGGARKITESQLSKQEIKNQILYGKGKMPPFQEVLTGAEVDALTDYAFKLSGR